MVDAGGEGGEEVVDEEGCFLDVELHGLVVKVEVGNLGDDVLELHMLPGIGGVVDHGEGSVVVLVVVDVQEGELGPLLIGLTGADDLGDVDALVEELQVLHQLLLLVSRVQDRELREHSNVSALKTKSRLEQRNELLKETTLLIVADELLKLVTVDDDVKTADLCKAELLCINAREVDLFPDLGAVGFASRVDSTGVLSELHEAGGEATKVGDVVEKEFGCKLV